MSAEITIDTWLAEHAPPHVRAAIEALTRSRPATLPDASDEIHDLAAALAQAQTDMPVVEKSETAAAGKYSYKYATLGQVLAVALPILGANGLSVVQRIGRECETLLIHSSGQWLRSTTPIAFEGGGPQQYGSAATYARRYALCAVLGIPLDDDDGNAAQRGRPVEPRYSAPAPPPAPPPAAPASPPAASASPSNDGLADAFIEQLGQAPTIKDLAGVIAGAQRIDNLTSEERGQLLHALVQGVKRVIDRFAEDGPVLESIPPQLGTLGLPDDALEEVRQHFLAAWEACPSKPGAAA